MTKILLTKYENSVPMNIEIKKVVNKIASILVSGIDAKQVYLFGSHAQNNANKDMMIIDDGFTYIRN